jgi:hypothetical protein
MLPASLVVMEIKVNERLPYWLTQMIAAHNLQVRRVSKCCRSIEAARNLPPTQRRCLPAEYSQIVSGASASGDGFPGGPGGGMRPPMP